MNPLEVLVKSLSRLPGLGPKSARRIAYFLLKADKAYTQTLARQITELKERVKVCSVCGSYTDDDPCPICRDPRRDRNLICVVEQPEDITTIEATNEYPGVFHVLKGVISPIDGIGPDDLNIPNLLKRIEKYGVSEVILAMNPTVEGDTTALYLGKLLTPLELKVTRLASGLPVGGDLEYADRITLARSLKGRVPL